MKYRSKNEIIEKILEESQEPLTITKIMYKSYLSYRQVKEYISYLLQHDLLKENKNTSEFLITTKGKEFLKSAKAVQDLLK